MFGGAEGDEKHPKSGAYITPKYITMFIRVIYLLKKSKDDLVENLGNKLNPFIYAMGIVGVLMSIC